MDRFLVAATRLFGLLATRHPQPVDFFYADFLPPSGRDAHSPDGAADPNVLADWAQTVIFFKDQGFIDVEAGLYGGFRGVTLTARGLLGILSPAPDGPGSLGEAFALLSGPAAQADAHGSLSGELGVEGDAARGLVRALIAAGLGASRC